MLSLSLTRLLHRSIDVSTLVPVWATLVASVSLETFGMLFEQAGVLVVTQFRRLLLRTL